MRVIDILNLTDDGMLDLRYCPITLEPGSRIQDFHIENADMSGAKFGCLILKNSLFQNCRFDKALFDTFNERSCRFENVSFRCVEFVNAGIGLHCSIYREVDFSDADLRDTSFYTPQFMSCTFDKTKLSRVDFSASNFVDCRFVGKLKTVWFNKYYRFPKDEEMFGKAPTNDMRNVDFTHAALWDVMFTGGLDLSTIKLPADGSHMLVKRFDLVMERIARELDVFPEQDRMNLEMWIEILTKCARTQQMDIINKVEITNHLGKEAGLLFLDKVVRYNSVLN